MITFLFPVLLLALSILLFFRGKWLDRKKFIEKHRLGNEHVLKVVERFLKEQELKK